ncbi:MAG: hypothetical protein ACREIP_04805, partial [Alphaproteobacteria bacterium]
MPLNATNAARPMLNERAMLPFLAGAAADALIGFDLLLAAGWLADWLAPGAASVGGVPIDVLLRGLGIAMIGWAVATFAFVWLDAGRTALWAVIALNEAWVIASVAAVVFGQDVLSAAGNTVLITVAAGVAAIAFAQFRT